MSIRFICRDIKKSAAFPEVYGIDITEIDGFDNLHHAEGILKGHSSVRLISTVLHIVIILSMAAPAGFLHQSVQQ